MLVKLIVVFVHAILASLMQLTTLAFLGTSADIGSRHYKEIDNKSKKILFILTNY